jgi:hypothetical protein
MPTLEAARRRVTAWRIVSAGLAIMLLAVLGLVVGLERKATISAEDRAAIRQVIQDRKVQRDRQQAQVDLQLQQQARVLCVVVMDFRARAQSPQSRATLDRAIRQLDCVRVLRVPPKGNR